MTREVICISTGQAGVQMSSGAWELFCMEHGIRPDGTVNETTVNTMNTSDKQSMNTFFYETGLSTYIPRAVIVDLEPTVIDEIRAGAYRNLFNPRCLITNNEDAANNYARGHFTIGRSKINETLESVRRQIDRCETFQGFFFLNGSGGGTGSGFTTLLLEKLSVEFGKSSKVLTNIFPGPTLSNAIVEPYNTCLYMSAAVEYSDISIMLDNEAVYRICTDSLHQSRPTFNCVNRLMAHVTSSITCSLRFNCSLNADMNQLETNLVPYPRIHFPTVSYAPILSQSCASHEICHPRQLIKDVFSPNNRLVSCNANEGKYMSCCTIIRGDCSLKHLNDGVNDLKKNNNIQFVDWCPTGFKIGLCHNPPASVPGSMMASSDLSCLMLANNTSIAELFQTTARKFQMLFVKRSFVHWFVGEGMEEGELNEALEEVQAIINDYTELEKSAEQEDAKIAEDQMMMKQEENAEVPYEGRTSLENVDSFDKQSDINVQDHDIKFDEDDERMLNEAKLASAEDDRNMQSDNMLDQKEYGNGQDEQQEQIEETDVFEVKSYTTPTKDQKQNQEQLYELDEQQMQEQYEQELELKQEQEQDQEEEQEQEQELELEQEQEQDQDQEQELELEQEQDQDPEQEQKQEEEEEQQQTTVGSESNMFSKDDINFQTEEAFENPSKRPKTSESEEEVVQI